MTHDREPTRGRFDYDVRWYLVPAAAVVAVSAVFAFVVVAASRAPVRDEAVPMTLAAEWAVAPLPADDDVARPSPRSMPVDPTHEPDLSKPQHPSTYETH